MKLSENTQNILKNFTEINKGALIKAGNVINTMAPQKTVFAEASVTETFPVEFGIYDLSGFLGFLSLFGPEPDIDFGEKSLTIPFPGGQRFGTWKYTAKNLLIYPPETKISMKSEDINFTIAEDDLLWVAKAAAMVQAPQIVLTSNGEKVQFVATDVQNNGANSAEQVIGDGNGDVYRMVFKTEYIKFIPGSYSVAVTKEGISKFTNKDSNLTYWVATEKEFSTFERKD